MKTACIRRNQPCGGKEDVVHSDDIEYPELGTTMARIFCKLLCLKTVMALGLALSLTSLPQIATAGSWTVELTRKQARKLAELNDAQRNTAMAVSQKGAWGRARNWASEQQASDWAMQNCRAYLKPGQPDCILYAVNGQRVAPATVQLKKVSQVYKPVNGRKAAAFHGLRPLNLSGNRPAAENLLKQIDAETRDAARLPRDTGLEAKLRNNSLAADDTRGFAIWLGADRVETWIKTQRGENLKIRWKSWLATPEGLVCMIDGHYLSSGKRVGDNCLFIESASGGRMVFSWLNSPAKKRKGLIIAADARLGAAR